VVPQLSTIEKALDIALAERGGPVTIADTADNTGGGAPGDSTYFLDALIARRVAGSAVGPLFDPGAVDVCHDAGVGARLRLRIGGKLCAQSGNPLDVDCSVIAIADRVIQQLNGGPSNLGRSAAIRIQLDGNDDGIDVILTTKRVQAGSPDLFSRLGV